MNTTSRDAHIEALKSVKAKGPFVTKKQKNNEEEGLMPQICIYHYYI